MYENFFEMRATPFVRNVPTERLYRSAQIDDAIGRLRYTADKQKFATVMAEPGCGKSTLIRMFVNELPRDKYLALYLSDSKLTPRWLYSGLLNQMGARAEILQRRFQERSAERAGNCMDRTGTESGMHTGRSTSS